MQFLKKNYEKVLLGLVLCGLVVAVGFLPFLVSKEKEDQENRRNKIIRRPSKPIAELNLGRIDNLLKRSDAPPGWDFSTGHKLFNPVKWRMGADGRWYIVDNEVNKLQVTNVTTLLFIVTLDSATTNEFGARYAIGMEHQAAVQQYQRRKRTFYASSGEKVQNAFTLREVKGPPENPDELVLELAGSGERISLSKAKPYQAPEGYEADLKYDPEKKVWTDQRLGSVLAFADGRYKIVDIKPNEVVLSDQSNDKRYTRPYEAAR
jgi:hypothetical protein